MKSLVRTSITAAALLAAGASLGAMLPQDAASRAGAAPERGPEVARLAAMEGLWKTETTVPGAPASTGLAKLSLIGGHWLIEEFSSEFGGEPFAGHGITGWDPKRKIYVNVWVDSLDTSLRVVDLTWDEAQKALVAEPQSVDLGGGAQSMRGVTRMPDADHMVFTLTPDAPDAAPMMTITYERSR